MMGLDVLGLYFALDLYRHKVRLDDPRSVPGDLVPHLLGDTDVELCEKLFIMVEVCVEAFRVFFD